MDKRLQDMLSKINEKKVQIQNAIEADKLEEAKTRCRTAFFLQASRR